MHDDHEQAGAPEIYGVLGQFDSTEALLDAAHKTREAGIGGPTPTPPFPSTDWPTRWAPPARGCR